MGGNASNNVQCIATVYTSDIIVWHHLLIIAVACVYRKWSKMESHSLLNQYRLTKLALKFLFFTVAMAVLVIWTIFLCGTGKSGSADGTMSASIAISFLVGVRLQYSLAADWSGVATSVVWIIGSLHLLNTSE